LKPGKLDKKGDRYSNRFYFSHPSISPSNLFNGTTWQVLTLTSAGGERHGLFVTKSYVQESIQQMSLC